MLLFYEHRKINYEHQISQQASQSCTQVNYCRSSIQVYFIRKHVTKKRYYPNLKSITFEREKQKK